MNDIRMAINTLKLANELSGIDKSEIDYMDNSHLYKANLTAISALEKELNNNLNPVKEKILELRELVWGEDIPSPVCPEYIEHHESIQKILNFIDNKLLKEGE